MESSKTRGIKLLVLLILVSNPIFSASDYAISQSLVVSSAYYFPNSGGYLLESDFAPIYYSKIEADSGSQRDLGSTWGAAELKISYKKNYTKNILTGTSFLTKENSIKYSFIGEISPVTVESGGEITMTPIAFFDIALGSTLATGWSAIGVIGLGLNNKDSKLPNSDAFQGVLSQSWLSGTIKFDTAAVLPGDKTWKHLILLSRHKLTYRHFSAASSGDPWIFQGGEGDRYNGFTYNHTSFLGYQMPLLIEKVGFLIESKYDLHRSNNASRVSDGGWGSDFLQLSLGALFNLKLSKQHSISIISQFKNNRRYTDSTNREIYFKNRKVDANSPEYWKFDRIALIYTYNF